MTRATDYLRDLAQTDPKAFPGADPDERNNAKRLILAVDALYNACVPLYREAAQSCLREDIRKAEENFKSGKEQTSDELLRLLAEEVRYLNGHGPEHLQMVDAKAFDLIQTMQLELAPYEVFFLAAALIIHDAGLIFGRDGHESSISSILQKLGDVAGTPQERRTIEKIASAHGGTVKGQPKNKATIDPLFPFTQVSGLKVREQLIAAIVRLADELAEDRSRASAIPFGSSKERKEKLRGSEVFHVYASRLESCLLDRNDQSVNLQFLLDIEDALDQFQKGATEVYLLDEIFDRVIKCLTELLYCNRFVYASAAGTGVKPLTEVRVSIQIYGKESNATPIIDLKCTLKEAGYPAIRSGGIAAYCSEVVKAMEDFGATHALPKADVDSVLQNGPTGLAMAELLARSISTDVESRQSPPTVESTLTPPKESKIRQFISRLLGDDPK